MIKFVKRITKIMEDFNQKVTRITDEIREMLLEKNRKYGNSALDPIRVFARSDSEEQINVRIDDKLNRIKNRANDEDEDVIKDLIGYLVLKLIKQNERNV